ncbi:hypothetical protein BN1723_011832 [Verticillium longisporum]|uniref:Uncharacterized protein n=1 Tax=Verticillium longisporum TaxID=100787 RepID=A0A0G4LBB2_VERLO|nr:hypothetical protein BN1723_011832 [Verticillium longisporum]
MIPSFGLESSRNSLFLLDLLFIQAPFVLQLLVECLRVHLLGPPFTPTSQENLFRIFRSMRGQAARTFGNGLGIRQTSGDHSSAPPQARPWDETWRNSHDGALSGELSPPPVRRKKVHKLALAVDCKRTGPRSAEQVLVERTWPSSISRCLHRGSNSGQRAY